MLCEKKIIYVENRIKNFHLSHMIYALEVAISLREYEKIEMILYSCDQVNNGKL
ncbi:hypothetical protein HanIR_Chr08g0375991 [Helianthus annuus]|nr:hypothetical protein HanIR_Chr08g0375991 [Helianthus annuus]